MTKEEKIQEAYGKHWNEVWAFIDDNGYCTQIDYTKSTSERRNHRTLFEMGFREDDGLLETGMCAKTGNNVWRPKSLQGIENNNGWIKIESEEDLPKEELDCHFVFKKNDIKYQTFGVWDNKLKSFWSGALRINYVTHYQPIIKPKLPIY